MDRTIHLLVLSEEGRTRKLRVKTYYLKICPVLFLLILFLTVVGLWALWNNIQLRQKLRGLEAEVVALHQERRDLLSKVARLENEKKELLAGAVGELRNRSEIIRQLVADLGLTKYVKARQKKAYKGGPYKPEGGIYVPLNEADFQNLWQDYETLLSNVDAYLEVLSKVPVGRPCPGYISSGFGRRKDPFTGKPAFHTGIDLVSYPGTPVKATADGKVIYAGRHSGYGKAVVIRHGYGYSTLYGHLKKITVRAGQRVKRGQIIGYLGNTGRSTGPHLHYEVRRYGRYLNPYRYIRIRLSRK